MITISDNAATGSEPAGYIGPPMLTSPESLERLKRRIDELPRSKRFVMTITKNDEGELFWTIQEMGRVER